MKKYNIQNYIRYKKDLEQTIKRIHKNYPPEIELKKHNTRITETRIIFQFLAADLFTLSKSPILLL